MSLRNQGILIAVICVIMTLVHGAGSIYAFVVGSSDYGLMFLGFTIFYFWTTVRHIMSVCEYEKWMNSLKK